MLGYPLSPSALFVAVSVIIQGVVWFHFVKLNKLIKLSGTSLFTLQFSLAFASAEEVGEEAVTTKKKWDFKFLRDKVFTFHDCVVRTQICRI